jgi:hypothetical protein
VDITAVNVDFLQSSLNGGLSTGPSPCLGCSIPAGISPWKVLVGVAVVFTCTCNMPRCCNPVGSGTANTVQWPTCLQPMHGHVKVQELLGGDSSVHCPSGTCNSPQDTSDCKGIKGWQSITR